MHIRYFIKTAVGQLESTSIQAPARAIGKAQQAEPTPVWCGRLAVTVFLPNFLNLQVLNTVRSVRYQRHFLYVINSRSLPGLPNDYIVSSLFPVPFQRVLGDICIFSEVASPSPSSLPLLRLCGSGRWCGFGAVLP